MLKKKGQLTLFMIIAIVVFIVIIIFYLSGSLSGEGQYDSKVEVLRNDVLDCFMQNYQESLLFVGFQGGYFDVPEPKREIDDYDYISFDVPYYYSSGEVFVPEISDIEKELETLADSVVISCAEEQKNNSEFDSIEFGAGDVSVMIGEEDISFVTNVLITVNYDNKSVVVDMAEYPVLVDSSIFHMQEIAKYIAEYMKNNNEWFPYSDVVEMSNEYDLYVTVNDAVDGSESSVEIMDLRENYYPSNYIFYNKYGAMDYEEVLPLLS